MQTARSALATAAALVLLAAPAGAQQSGAVDIVDSAYEPEQITIEAGGTVTWTHTGNFPHSVTADDGSFDSSPGCGGSGSCMTNGQTFEETFDEPGEYPYYCRLHGGPGGQGMSGVVIVTAAQEPGGGTGSEASDEPSPQPTSDAGEGGQAEVTGSIEVDDQSGDGTAVVVSSVTITGSAGFVVVHADNDGGPGAVLGHVAIPEGTSTGVSVPLDEPLTADATVWPMLHTDAGTPGTYEFPGADGPVKADGAVVMAPLDLTLAAAADESGLPTTGAWTAALLALAVALLAAGALTLRRHPRHTEG